MLDKLVDALRDIIKNHVKECLTIITEEWQVYKSHSKRKIYLTTFFL